MRTTTLRMYTPPAVPPIGPAIVLMHCLAWTVYITLIYLANLITDPGLPLGRSVLFLLPFVITFYVSVMLLRAVRVSSILWVSSALLLFFLVMAGIGYIYVYFLMPIIGITIYSSAEPAEFFKGALLGLLQYFAYALLYHYVESNMRKKTEMNALNEFNLRTQVENAKLREAELQSVQENLLLEQAFLKAEINPHLLHNTLNVLYAQAQPLSQDLADNIAKLSRMMRFSIETTEGQPGKVPAAQEIECLGLLLEIHHMRFRDLKPVTILMEGSPDGHLLPPLSLTTLVENAMKYGDFAEPAEPVMISIVIRENEFHFLCRNRVRRRMPVSSSTNRGLSNLKRRLDVSFSKLHIMDTHRDDNFYTAELRVFRHHV